MCNQRGRARLELDYEIYMDTVKSLTNQIDDLTYKHSRMKLIKADTYNLAQEIRALGIQKARAEGKAMKIGEMLKR